MKNTMPTRLLSDDSKFLNQAGCAQDLEGFHKVCKHNIMEEQYYLYGSPTGEKSGEAIKQPPGKYVHGVTKYYKMDGTTPYGETLESCKTKCEEDDDCAAFQHHWHMCWRFGYHMFEGKVMFHDNVFTVGEGETYLKEDIAKGVENAKKRFVPEDDITSCQNQLHIIRTDKPGTALENGGRDLAVGDFRLKDHVPTDQYRAFWSDWDKDPKTLCAPRTCTVPSREAGHVYRWNKSTDTRDYLEPGARISDADDHVMECDSGSSINNTGSNEATLTCLNAKTLRCMPRQNP